MIYCCYPNPFDQTLFIDLYLPKGETLEINILDLNDKIVLSNKCDGKANLNSFSFKLNEKWPDGTYTVQISFGETFLTEKIIKQSIVLTKQRANYIP